MLGFVFHIDIKNLPYKTHPEFWLSPGHISKRILYHKMGLILEIWRYYDLAEKAGCHLINFTNGHQGADSIKRCHLTSIGNPIVEIRRSYNRLISTMRFPILVRWHLYLLNQPPDGNTHHWYPIFFDPIWPLWREQNVHTPEVAVCHQRLS